MLTMEEAVLGRNVRPSGIYARWTDSSTYAFYSGNGWKTCEALSGEEGDYVPASLPEGFPHEAENITPSGSGAYAYTVGLHLVLDVASGTAPRCDVYIDAGVNAELTEWMMAVLAG